MHPPVEPFDHGWLRRPGGAEIYWETSGNPDGRPALYLHGGPGGGLGTGEYRRRFDPERYLVVGLDQRGCGRSRPWAIDDLANLDTNTTDALIADIEALRDHLGIEAWLVHGVSWGSTLALAYALERPGRVTELVLTAVTSGAREEIDWITHGVGAVFPEAWEAFASAADTLARSWAAGVDARSFAAWDADGARSGGAGPGGERVVDTYARLLRDAGPAVRTAAATAWDTWEAAHISFDAGDGRTPEPLHEDARHRENFATLVTHYWSHDCFLPGARRIRDRIGELDGVPGVLIHGRRDVSGPAITPWRLHRAWSTSTLTIVEGEGHGGEREMALTMAAIDGFATS